LPEEAIVKGNNRPRNYPKSPEIGYLAFTIPWTVLCENALLYLSLVKSMLLLNVRLPSGLYLDGEQVGSGIEIEG